MTEVFAVSGFRKRFEAKARLGDYLAEIPTYVITAEYPSFLGLAGYIDRNASAE